MKKIFTIILLIMCLNFSSAFEANAQTPLLAFVKRDGEQSNIWTMRADGSARKRLTSDGKSGSPAWSPDGRTIAYVANSQVYLMNGDGNGKRALTRDTKWSANSPSFSPNGKQLLIRISKEVVPSDGEQSYSIQGVRQVNINGKTSKILASESSVQGFFFSPAIVPRQSAFYYMNEGGDYATGSLHRFDWKTKRSRKVYGYAFSDKTPPYYDVGNFALSPDGKRIAFQSIGWVNTKANMSPTDTNKAGIVVMNSDGTGARLILKDKAESSGLCWSSDGRKIIFANQYALQSLDLKSGKKTVLLRGGGLSSPAFQPVTKR